MKLNGKWCAGVMGVNCMYLFPTLPLAMSHWRLEICHYGSIYMWKWANECFKLGIPTFAPLPYPKSWLLYVLSPHHWLEYTSYRQGFHPLSIKNIDLPNFLLVICLYSPDPLPWAHKPISRVIFILQKFSVNTILLIMWRHLLRQGIKHLEFNNLMKVKYLV